MGVLSQDYIFKPLIKIENIEEVAEALKKQERFRPTVFGFTAKHSEYQEYGTGPQRGRSSYWISKEGVEAIDEWLRIKLGVQDEKERRSRAYAIARKIGKYGMKPRPFFRPAIHVVMEELEVRINNGESFMDISEAIIEQAHRNIDAWGMDYKGDLRTSSFSEYIDNVGGVEFTDEELREAMEDGWNRGLEK